MAVAATDPTSVPQAEKKKVSNSTFVRVMRYSGVRLLTLFVTAVIAIYLDEEIRPNLLALLEWHARARLVPGSTEWGYGRFIEEWADPRALATRWSSCTRRVEPQIAPESSFHWHLPPSRSQTARRTCAGTYSGSDEGRGEGRGFFTSAFRFASRARRRSSPASRISSTVAPGRECERATRAASSFSRKRRETVTPRRLSSAVSGSHVDSRERGGADGHAGAGAGS